LKDTKGWISWGTADKRVNYSLDRQLAAQMSSSVSKIEYLGEGHDTTAPNVADIVKWVAMLPSSD